MKRILISIFSLLFVLPGCGTDSGNPSFVSDLLGGTTITVCSKLESCFVGVPVDCQSKMLTAANFTTGMGLNSATYPDLSSVFTAMDSGFLSVDTAKQGQCHTAIDNLSCASSEVTSSYSTSTPSDFSNTFNLLTVDPACQQMVY